MFTQLTRSQTQFFLPDMFQLSLIVVATCMQTQELTSLMVSSGLSSSTMAWSCLRRASGTSSPSFPQAGEAEFSSSWSVLLSSSSRWTAPFTMAKLSLQVERHQLVRCCRGLPTGDILTRWKRQQLHLPFLKSPSSLEVFILRNWNKPQLYSRRLENKYISLWFFSPTLQMLSFKWWYIWLCRILFYTFQHDCNVSVRQSVCNCEKVLTYAHPLRNVSTVAGVVTQYLIWENIAHYF